jgi:hypothetical protein
MGVPGVLGHGCKTLHDLLQAIALIVDARHNAGNDIPLALSIGGGSRRQVEDGRR